MGLFGLLPTLFMRCKKKDIRERDERKMQTLTEGHKPIFFFILFSFIFLFFCNSSGGSRIPQAQGGNSGEVR